MMLSQAKNGLMAASTSPPGTYTLKLDENPLTITTEDQELPTMVVVSDYLLYKMFLMYFDIFVKKSLNSNNQ